VVAVTVMVAITIMLLPIFVVLLVVAVMIAVAIMVLCARLHYAGGASSNRKSQRPEQMLPKEFHVVLTPPAPPRWLHWNGADSKRFSIFGEL
jgi:flagellar basal body-associated protein FliL